METYTLLRAFADSWMVVGLMLFFAGMVLWIFRPAARSLQRDAATSIFRHEQKPAPVDGADAAASGRVVKEVRDVR